MIIVAMMLSICKHKVFSFLYVLFVVISSKSNVVLAAVFETTTSLSTPGVVDTFGYTIAVSGSFVAVGISESSTANKVHVFEETSGGGLTQIGYTLNTTFTGQPGSWYGSSVAFHGHVMVVGAPDYLVPDSQYIGAVYVYMRNDIHTRWIYSDILLPTATTISPSLVGNSGDKFGCSVAVLDKAFLAVGAKAASSRGICGV